MNRMKSGFVRRTAAILLALTMALSGSVCAFADVDGNSLIGDSSYSDMSTGDSLISKDKR